MNDRIIIGIDPGTNIMGYGIIKVSGSKFQVSGSLSGIKSSELQNMKNKNREMELIKLDVIKLNSLKDQAIKLKKIFETTLALMNEYKPDELAIEAPFFGKNIQSMLKLGRAQGVAMAAALYREIPIFEYSPRKIKQAITGNGSASKEQVAAMLKNLLKIKDTPKYLDATDGLAVAVCHFFQKTTNNDVKKFSGWNAFISQNPDRVK